MQTPDFTSQQGYRTALGVTQAATGAGVRVSDVEMAWDLDHEDLKGSHVHAPAHVPTSMPDAADHGTAVLGIMGATANGFGVTGMAPDADYYVSPEMYADGTGSTYHPAQAVNDALANSRPGDVVILEMQAFFKPELNEGPQEVIKSYFDAIKAATDRGVVVVEPAGNGSQDLDSPDYAGYRQWGDSGAIIVGAAQPDGTPEWFTTRGSRVNVHGWGDSVVSTGAGDLVSVDDDPHRKYTQKFGGTSGATPMIAAAAADLESYAKAHHPNMFIAPAKLRELLATSGTPQTPDQQKTAKIGPAPNIAAAIQMIDADPKRWLSQMP